MIAAALAAGVAPALGNGRPGDAPSAVGAMPSVPATPMKPPGVLVESGTCANACRAQHEQCRIVSKGDPRCGQMLTACLQRCISSKGR